MAKSIQGNKQRLSGLGIDIPAADRVGRDAAEVGIGIITVLAALIGIWGIACLVGGIVQSGGVGELVNGYLSAVTGR